MRKDRKNPSRIGIFCWIGALLMGFVAADAEFAAAHSLDAQAPTHLTTRPAALARGVGR